MIKDFHNRGGEVNSRGQRQSYRLTSIDSPVGREPSCLTLDSLTFWRLPLQAKKFNDRDTKRLRMKHVSTCQVFFFSDVLDEAEQTDETDTTFLNVLIGGVTTDFLDFFYFSRLSKLQTVN